MELISELSKHQDRMYIYEEISAERNFQDKKHPDFQPDNAHRLAVLTEEVGEVAKGIQEKDITNLRYELIQVAAVAVRWIEAIDKSYPSLDNKQK